jgi:hypothetical protein
MMRLVTSLGTLIALIALMALTEASTRGESVLVNMTPKTHDVWTGNIYSRSSGSTYYATMTLKSSGKLHVEACQVPRRSLRTRPLLVFRKRPEASRRAAGEIDHNVAAVERAVVREAFDTAD